MNVERCSFMAIFDRVKYDGRPGGESWLIYKFPDEDLTLGSQLVVAEGQQALFLKGGAIQAVFDPGTHTLTTKNFPFLKKLIGLPFGGKTPFAAEIYYINTTSRLGMGWGTQTPFEMEDPRYGIIVSVRSYGTYSLRIAHAETFVSSLIGAIPQGTQITHEFVHSHFNSIVLGAAKTVIASFMIRTRVSFLEVTPFLSDLSAACANELNAKFAEYGLELSGFVIESINTPKEEHAVLKKDKQDVALGMDFYAKKRSFDIMENAARGQAGGIAMMGAGFNMMAPMQGFFGNQLGGVVNNVTQPSQPVQNQISCPSCGASNAPGQKFCGVCGASLETGKKCQTCGATNAPGQKFCGVCGTSLEAKPKCPSCGAENAIGQKFCGVCGTPLSGAVPVPKPKGQYQIFISYRRSTGKELARLFYYQLKEEGYRVFFDMETMDRGKFNEQLYNVIDDCDDFVLVLSEGALDRCASPEDWVRHEIEHAIEKGKNIIPVFTPEFVFPADLPATMKELPYYQGVPFKSEFFDASVQKIVNLLVSRK